LLERMKIMKRKPFYAILLILVTVLFSVIGDGLAQGQPGSSFVAPVLYEVILTNDSPAEAQWSTLEAPMPPGSVYVGLAAGSQIGTEAEQQGDLLIWRGPFTVSPQGELVLRYWLAPTTPGLQAPPMEVTALKQDGVALLASAQPAELVVPDRTVPEDVASPEAVTVQKIAETPQLTRDDHLWIAYRVTFSNSSGSPAVLDEISDTLAPGFEFGGMAYGSDLGNQPVDPQAPTVVWNGPFTVPGGGTFQLRYWVKVAPVAGNHVNSVVATGGGVPVGPAQATVTVLSPHLSLAKGASAPSVTVAKPVTYDVTIANTGDYQGVIDVISDTLPAGFVFLSMNPASDVQDLPDVSGSTLTWMGLPVIPASSEIHLIYQVRAGKVGNQTNSVIAVDKYGEQIGPVENTIQVLPAKVFLPFVASTKKPTTLPLVEAFTTEIPPEWVPFVNYPELDARDWDYEGDRKTWGRLDFYAGEPLSQWALDMYLGEGAQEWTDYRIETTFRAGKEWPTTPKLVGVWFRGTHEKRTDNKGGLVGGYMFLLKPDDSPAHAKAYIGHIDPTTRKLGFVKDFERQFTNQRYTYHDVIIEVRGANIQVWVDGARIINWTDPKKTWTQGTVGFVVYQGSGAFDNIRVTELD